MSIQKFNAAFQASNVECVILASSNDSFEQKVAFQYKTCDEDGWKHTGFLRDDLLEFVIFEFEDACSEIGIAINGVLECYRILTFSHLEKDDMFLLNTIIKSESNEWQEHEFLIKIF